MPKRPPKGLLPEELWRRLVQAPWPGYHDALPRRPGHAVRAGGLDRRRARPIDRIAGDLADLLAALPRDTSVHLDPVVWAAGPAPWV